MPNSVVIGMGGSGKWVVTYLKQMLEELHGGEMPSHVSLLSIDLAGKETPPIALDVVRNGRKDVYELDFGPNSKDFCHFGQYWAKPIFSIQNAPEGTDYPSIRSWLKPDDAALYNLSTGDLTTTAGAGQKRQASRCCLFLALEQDEVRSQIRAALNHACTNLPENESLIVHLVGSVAGGTGCGSFVDIATIVQSEARGILHPRGCNLIGYFVLPKSFSAVVDDKQNLPLMDANCFAALRELQRFMHFNRIRIDYPAPVGSVQNETRLLDLCYLVDGTRPADSGAEDISTTSPRTGLFPGIADYIFHQIVHPLPTDHAQLLTQIAQDMQGKHRTNGAPIYSTFGVRTIIFDAEAVVATLAQKLAGETFTRFLQPSPDPENVVRDQVHDFLRDGSVFDQTILSYVNATASRSVTRDSLFALLRLGEKLDRPLPMLHLRRPPTEVATSKLFSSVDSQTVKGQAEALIARNLGKSEDELKPGIPASYHAVLKWYLAQLAERFRLRIEETVQGMLRAGDGQGGLDHAWKFLKELAGYERREPGAAGKPEQVVRIKGIYEQFSDLVAELFDHQTRVPRDRIAEARTAAAKAEKEMLDSRNNGGRQQEYLDKKQVELEYDQWLLVLDYIQQIAAAHRDICASLLQQAESWIYTFTCALQQHERAYRDWVDVRTGKAAIKVREYVTLPDDETERRLYDLFLGRISNPMPEEQQVGTRIAKVDIGEVMRTFTWGVHDSRIECSLPAEYAPLKEVESSPIVWNHGFVDNILRRGYFATLRDVGILDVLALKKTGVGEFCDRLSRTSSPFSNLSLQDHPPVRQWDTSYVPALHTPPGQSVSDAIHGTLPNAVAPHSTHVISRYQALHHLFMDAFVALAAVEPIYRARSYDVQSKQVISPPLHNFGEEKHAALLEARLPLLGKEETVRNLHIDAVHALSDASKLRLLALGLYHGLISAEFDAKERATVYRCDVTIRDKCESVILGRSLLEALNTLASPRPEDLPEQLSAKCLVADEAQLKKLSPEVYGKKIIGDVLDGEQWKIRPADRSAEDDLRRVLKIALLLEADDFVNPKPKGAAFQDVY